MELTELEMSRLRLEDGEGTEQDRSAVREAGLDISADQQLRITVRRALMSVETPSIAEKVMRRIGASSSPVGDAVRTETPPALADGVMAALGKQRPEAGLADALRTEAGVPEPIWPRIASAVGGSVDGDFGSLLRAGIAAEGNFQPQGWLTARRKWAVGGAVAAFAAAAALLLTVGSSSTQIPAMATAAMGPILDAPVEIEDLEVGAASLVQVLQFGEDAPTIIFVSDDTQGDK